jgi:GNAT superfamily N-acetyltransferase
MTNLYFLRSSENKIVENMCKYAHPTSQDSKKYTHYYGLTSKDLGLYALVENNIAGAIWSRILSDETLPTISLAVLPTYRYKGVAKMMMEQFLLEAATIYDKLQVDTYNNEDLKKFYTKFGFKNDNNSSIFTKELEKKELIRPTDGYDASKWMD